MRIEKEIRVQSEGRSFILDMLLEDQNSIFYIEVKRRLTPEAIANFYIAKEVITKFPGQGKERKFIIASQCTDEIYKKMATLLGIRFLKISLARSDPNFHGHSERTNVKITSKKAWKVVFSLLKYGPTSIYNIMKMGGVSYGEAHRVISSFRNRNLLKQNGNFVSVFDLKPILNEVFWERPIRSLLVKHYKLKYGTDEDVPRIISNLLHRNGIEHAFTGATAYERYFGGIRNESSYNIYVDKSNPFFNDLITEFTSSDEKNAKLSVYKTDRDVFSGSTKIGDVILDRSLVFRLSLYRSGTDRILWF